MLLPLLAAFACTTPPPPPPEAPACLGPERAPTGLVYLHGMDSEPPSEQELANRALLGRLAEELGLRVALPRAPKACPESPGLLCWGWRFDAAEVEAGLAATRRAREACLGERPYGVLGFSNGGVMAESFVRDCAEHGAGWLIAVGASGVWSPADEAPRAGCGDLSVWVGAQDAPNLPRAQAFVDWLAARGAGVRLETFEGGHALEEGALRAALAEALK